MPTGPLCLPATGLDGGSIAIVALIALAIIAVGIVALRKNKAAAAFILVPLAVLTLAFGGSAAPAQAIATPIADFTVSENWTPDGSYFSDPASPENLASLGTLDDLVTDEDAVQFFLTLSSEDGTESVSLDPNEAGASVGDGVAEVNSGAVDAAQLLLNDRFGDLILTYVIAIPYLDDCGNPWTTVVTWTGTVSFPPPVP